ncbi:DUF3052 domain-containing protein [Streptomyces sp. NPDC056399]|uniref:DUF3052 domain-containing protein n=1 Tax=Streptomyces sp. NPDC056399 TaxID=3345807 RepID=UPI0035E2FEC4
MTSTAKNPGIADRLGIGQGMVVQEFGFDDDVDMELRTAVERAIGSSLVDDHEGVTDVALLWFREDDGDLVDTLVDTLGPLSPSGTIWLLTPKSGRHGYIEPSDIAEAAPTAGLAATASLSAAPDWAGTRLVTVHNSKKR